MIEGLNTLKKAGTHFSISYLLMAKNIFAIEKMVELAERIKPDFVSFHNINPHGCQEYKPLTIQDKNTKLFLEGILKRSDYPFDIDLSVIFDTECKRFKNAKCIQPWYFFALTLWGTYRTVAIRIMIDISAMYLWIII